MRCTICNSPDPRQIYSTRGMPIFQNKVYPDKKMALQAEKADVTLAYCHSCGYVFNSGFDAGLMDYDETYQNEQANSPYFKRYIDSIVTLLDERGFRDKKIVEIGCGKGAFLKQLWKRGFDAVGFDPAYEGKDNRIVKDYYSSRYSSDVNADLIILRHTLEHVPAPYDFLKSITATDTGNTHIYIEVPSFEWIVSHHAFWDIFFEHCSYFTTDRLTSFFRNSEHGLLFNGQYQYIIASLSRMRLPLEKKPVRLPGASNLRQRLNEYKVFVKKHPGLFIWGAGAKGATFVNLTDPNEEHIACVIDINEKKQGQFIAGTGHRVESPDILDTYNGGDILVMNENYADEIRTQIDTLKYHLHVLG